MDDLGIVKLSLIGSFFGLFLLFIAFLFIEPKETNISEIDNIEESDVRIEGQVIDIKNFGSTALIEIAEIKSINVVVFDKRMLKFTVGDTISVTGELKKYKGKTEIIAEKIKVKNYDTNR